MLILGADPGLSGAIAAFDTKSGALEIHDMPLLRQDRKNKSTKRIINELALWQLFEFYKLGGATHFVVEVVGGLPRQSAPAAFNFGYGAGLLRMAAVGNGYAIEPVEPQKWKNELRVGTHPMAIRARANELMPQYATLWAYNGGKEMSEVGLGRAEAAMIALYGARKLWMLDKA